MKKTKQKNSTYRNLKIEAVKILQNTKLLANKFLKLLSK